MERINAKNTARAVTTLRTTPGELRDIANHLEAAGSNGNALPGQFVHYDASPNHRFEWDPEITSEKFAKATSTPLIEKIKEWDEKYAGQNEVAPVAN